MKWRGRRQSENVEDRRGLPRGGRTAAAGGGIGVLLIILVVGLLGGDVGQVMQQLQQQPPQVRVDAGGGGADGAPLTQLDREQGDFVKTVLADTEQVWTGVFGDRLRKQYRPATLVLFSEQTRSGCGLASSAGGPFYCPADEKVYLDTAFFDQLSRQLGAPGDFAQAYVIAHEVGHHVQNLLGVTDQLDQLRRKLPEVEYNKYSVRLELQADFYAGMMFHHAQKRWNILEPGDIEEGLRAAAAIGDDTLQERGGGRARQETFTHGSSAQRVRWFKLGLKNGDIEQGDTFGTTRL